MDPYENLSDDDQTAFLQLEKEFRDEFYEARESDSSSWLEDSARYMTKTLAAAQALGIDAISSFVVDTRDGDEHVENFADFQRAIDNLIVQIRIGNARSRNRMSVGLSEPQKAKIHHLIEKIRTEV